MTRCGACGRENPATFRFCGGCGSALPAAGCPSCGFDNPPGLRFCGRCGAAQPEAAAIAEPAQAAAAPPAPAAVPVAVLEERKLATVVFADVVGFTALAETTDPETLSRRVDAAFRGLAAIVQEHGGTVDKYMGDSLMAVFGVPVSHGDDAERAVAAALAMARHDGDLRFSIGVNSGEVMVTAVAGGGVTVMGDTVNVAARLEKVAAAGEVLLGPLTADLVADRVDLRPREAVLLKGKREPVPVFEAVALSDRAAAAASDADAPPLVDREDELAFLRSMWRRTVAGRGPTAVLLTGDAGVGKTRLIDELVAGLGDTALVARSACLAYGTTARARVMADWGRGLGVIKEAGARDCEDPVAAPRSEEEGMVALRRLLAARAAERPLLLVLDDCHHAEAESLGPLARLLPRLGGLPLLLILAGRSEPAGWLAAFSGPTTLHLDCLAADDAVTLATALAGDLRLTPAAAAGLAARSQGNPLHLRELVRLLRARGDLVAESAADADGGRPGLPPTLQTVLAARLDALVAAEKAALQAMAVLATVSGAVGSDQVAALEIADARTTLDRLVTAGLLRHADSGDYEIVDPLLREVAYETLPRTVRGHRHQHAAAVAPDPVSAARHLDLAAGYLPEDTALVARAARELAATGVDLAEASRFPEAAQLLGRAVELGHPDPAVLVRLAYAQTERGRPEAAVAVLDRLGDGPDDPAIAADAIHARGLALSRMDQASVAASVRLLEEAKRRWEALDRRDKVGWAIANQAFSLFDLGRVGESAERSREALDIFVAIGDRVGATSTAQLLALTNPDDPRAAAWLTEALAAAEQSGNLAQQRNALIILAWFHYLRTRLGGPEETGAAIDLARRLSRVASEVGDPSVTQQGHLILASLARLRGDLAEAAAELERAEAACATTSPLFEAIRFGVALAVGEDPEPETPPATASPDPYSTMATAIVVEALLLAGRPRQALLHLRESRPPAIDRPALARLVAIADGAALVLAGRHQEAVGSLGETLETARQMGATATEATALAFLAEAALARGDREAAMALLARAGSPGGVAGLTVDRARALSGDHEAAQRLAAEAARLHAPGLTRTEAVAAG